jgi:hypothetical protein
MEKKRIIFGVRKQNQKTEDSRQSLMDSHLMMTENEEEEEVVASKKHWTNKLIIKETSKLKAAYDIYINLIVAYSCFETIYIVCFSPNIPNYQQYFDDYYIQICFLIDIIFSFLTEYKDPETYETIRSISKIGKRYVFKGSFIVDTLAVFPFNLIFASSKKGNSIVAARLLRLFRLPRLVKLIDISRFN